MFSHHFCHYITQNIMCWTPPPAISQLSLGHKQIKGTEKTLLKRILDISKRSTEVVVIKNNQNLSGIPTL